MTVQPLLDVRFAVRGVPKQKGSMSGFPVMRNCKRCRAGAPCGNPKCKGGKIAGVAVTDQGDAALKAWQTLVHYEAISARNKAGCRLAGPHVPIGVTLIFVMPRPDGHWSGRSLSAAGLDRRLPSVRPDLDKLSRTAFDALTGSVVTDDAQVCMSRICKVYSGYRGWTGIVVRVFSIDLLDRWVDEELMAAGVIVPEPHPRIAGI